MSKIKSAIYKRKRMSQRGNQHILKTWVLLENSKIIYVSPHRHSHSPLQHRNKNLIDPDLLQST